MLRSALAAVDVDSALVALILAGRPSSPSRSRCVRHGDLVRRRARVTRMLKHLRAGLLACASYDNEGSACQGIGFDFLKRRPTNPSCPRELPLLLRHMT